MSLAEEAYRERKWGSFPALRQTLEDKEIPSHYYGPTSASDNMFEAINRLIEMSVLVSEHENHIRERAQSIGGEEIYKDLRKFEDALEQLASFISKIIEKVQILYATL